MKNYMKNRWDQEELIGVNSLVKKDGTVVIINFTNVKLDNEIKYFIQPVCDTTISSLEKYDDDIWTEVQPLCSFKDETTGNKYVGGEGGMGNEGFVVCLSPNDEPNWGLFLVNSNPFYDIKMNDGIIEAISSSDLKFLIDINFPEKVQVETI